MKQWEIILKAMLENPNKVEWTAKDFQSGKYFVGYEATARMSDLIRMYPNILIIGKQGRFRTLAINWENKEEINQLIKELLGGDNNVFIQD